MVYINPFFIVCGGLVVGSHCDGNWVLIWDIRRVPLWSGINFVTFFVTKFAFFRKKLKALFTNN